MDVVTLQKQRLNEEATAALQEAERLSMAEKLDKSTRARIDVLLATASQKRQQAAALKSDDEIIAHFNRLADETGNPRISSLGTDEPAEQRIRAEQNKAFRNYLAHGMVEKRAMSVATDAAGGYFVPQDFYANVTAALKQTDGLWNDDVITLVESDHGNAMTFPLIDDTAAAATIIAENTSPSEVEIGIIDRLLLGKIPTWKSGRFYSSIELLQDSALNVEKEIITPAVVKRFQRGCGAANVATLIASTTSGATSAAPTAVTLDDCLSLMASVDAAYVASEKCFWGMNFATLVSLLKLKSSLSGDYLWTPRTDAKGRLMLFEKPIVLIPSLPSAASNAVGTVVFGDFSRAVRRTVKNSLTILRYEQTVGLAEAGIVGFQGFLRTSFGVLASTSSSSPIKYLTQHA